MPGRFLIAFLVMTVVIKPEIPRVKSSVEARAMLGLAVAAQIAVIHIASLDVLAAALRTYTVVRAVTD